MVWLQNGGMGADALIVVGVTLGVFLFLISRKWVPALRVAGGPVERSALRRAENAERELKLANDEIATLEQAKKALERERSLAAVIDLVLKVSVGVDKTLDKLAEMNGTFKAATAVHEESVKALATSTQAIEFLAAQVVNRG